MTHPHPHPHLPASPSHRPPPSLESGGPAIDPVCGMEVDPRAPRGGQWAHDGHTWSFCGEKCRQRFQADPERYLQPRTPPPPAAPGATWVCPMDPEVRQDAPGPCPKCGMALEPEAPPMLETRVESESILYRTLALFGVTFVAGAALFVAVVLWVRRQGKARPATV